MPIPAAVAGTAPAVDDQDWERFLALGRLERLTHVGETLLSRLRDGQQQMGGKANGTNVVDITQQHAHRPRVAPEPDARVVGDHEHAAPVPVLGIRDRVLGDPVGQRLG